jgi:hypothetical protein
VNPQAHATVVISKALISLLKEICPEGQNAHPLRLYSKQFCLTRVWPKMGVN